jgi:hypothetical protein
MDGRLTRGGTAMAEDGVGFAVRRRAQKVVVLALPMLLFLSTGGAAARAATLGFSVEPSGPGQGGVLELRAVDEATGLPLPDARFETAELGGGLRRVTASRTGFATTSLAGVRAGRVTLFLKRAEDVPQVVLSGGFREWHRRTGLGHVLGGITLRPIGAADLVTFDSRIVLSPLRDVIQVFGDRRIPSNLMFPDQDLFLPVGGVTLNKPEYRLPVPADRDMRLVSLQAEIRALDILPSFQSGGKLSLDLLNKVRIHRVGLSEVFTPRGDQRVELDAQAAVGGRHEVTVTRPSFPSDVIVGAGFDLRGDRSALVPTDVKVALTASRFTAPIQPVLLGSVARELGVERIVLALALADGGRRLAVNVLGAGNSRAVSTGAFLEPAAAANPFPQLPDAIQVEPTPQGVTTLALGSHAVGDGRTTHPQWVLHVLPGAGPQTVDPRAAVTAAPVQHYSITRLEFAGGFREDAIDARGQFRTLSRMSRASARQASVPAAAERP